MIRSLRFIIYLPTCAHSKWDAINEGPVVSGLTVVQTVEGMLIRRLRFVKMTPDCLRCFAWNDGSERFGRGLLYVAQAAEMREQPLPGLRAHAGNIQEFRVAITHGSPLAVIAHRKAVTLVANELDEMKHRRASVEHDGLVFIAVEVDHFFLFCNGRQWLRREAERLKRVSCRMELAKATIYSTSDGIGLSSSLRRR